MRRAKLLFVLLSAIICGVSTASADMAMQNTYGRDGYTLNGRWAILPDLTDQGLHKNWGQPQKAPEGRLNEVYFEGGATLHVPGDWNSQNPEFTYFEDIMWYKRTFYHEGSEDRRYFLHFGAVSSHAVVFMNGVELGEHKGSFTPFQFEVTDIINEGENSVIVRVSNIRRDDIIPAHDFDWWNYGGITRDVDIISTPKTYIEDYWVRLEKGSMQRVLVDVKLNGDGRAKQSVTLKIQGTQIEKRIKTDENGEGQVAFNADLELWSPDSPKLYDVELASEYETISDKIGFRCFETRGTEIFLNGTPIYIKGVNLHEEIGSDRRRSVGEQDAEYLVDNVLELGCNYVRLTHYPADVHLVRKCEERGLMVWEEVPVRGDKIDFTNKEQMSGAEYMMEELIERDKNRCGVVMWSVANETLPKSENRNEFLISFIEKCRAMDDTRAITFATNAVQYEPGETTVLKLNDPIADYVDIIGINRYIGWYTPWLDDPAKTTWIIRDNKPIVMSEFGAGSVYGQYGSATDPQSWSEDYMVTAYNDYLASFESIPNLRGVMPWLMFDFRSIRRSHAKHQQGWNRKGLLSPDGDKKQAWYIMHDYYKNR